MKCRCWTPAVAAAWAVGGVATLVAVAVAAVAAAVSRTTRRTTSIRAGRRAVAATTRAAVAASSTTTFRSDPPMRMPRMRRKTLPGLTLLAIACASLAHAEGGVFIGSTPCGPQVVRFLGVPPQSKCEVVRWELSLAVDAKNEAPGPAIAQIEFGVDGQPLTKLKRELTWVAVNGTAER